MTERQLTGRKVLMIAIAAFGIVIAANIAMLVAATGSFPGLVVKNSYVAGQGWNARAEAHRALGWQAHVSYADTLLSLDLSDASGQPVEARAIEASIGRPSTDVQDQVLMLEPAGDRYQAPLNLDPGPWQIELRSIEGVEWKATARILVPEGG